MCGFVGDADVCALGMITVGRYGSRKSGAENLGKIKLLVPGIAAGH